MHLYLLTSPEVDFETGLNQHSDMNTFIYTYSFLVERLVLFCCDIHSCLDCDIHDTIFSKVMTASSRYRRRSSVPVDHIMVSVCHGRCLVKMWIYQIH